MGFLGYSGIDILPGYYYIIIQNTKEANPS